MPGEKQRRPETVGMENVSWLNRPGTEPINERLSADEIRTINHAAAVFDGVVACSWGEQKALAEKLFAIAGNPKP